LFVYERIFENRVKINLKSEAYQSSDESIFINQSNKHVGLEIGGGRKTYDKMPMGANRINDVRKKCFWDDIIFIISKETLTEIESAISSSIILDR